MSSILWIIHKETNYVVWSGTRDGRGRGSFPGEFYDVIGDNPNIQLNFSLKPEFTAVSVVTNTDRYLCSPCRGCPCNRYCCCASCQAAIAAMNQKIADLNARLAIEAPLYRIWRDEQLQDLTFEELEAIQSELQLEAIQLEDAASLCLTLGSDGMINDCLDNNALSKDLNQKRLLAITERLANMTPSEPEPTPGVDQEDHTVRNIAIAGGIITLIIGIAAAYSKTRK